MIGWLVLASVVVAVGLVAAGFYLGQAQSSSALNAAATLSRVMNETSDQLFRQSQLAPLVEASTEQSIAVSKQLETLLERVDRMDATQGGLLDAFIHKGLIREEDPNAGLQAGELPRSRKKPPPLPASSLPEV